MTATCRTIISNSPEETQSIAETLVAALPESAVIALHGELGSGKTCFVQGIAEALGIDRVITSPTFTMVNEYRGTRPLYHIDLYRIRHPDELAGIGFDDYLDPDGITAIEWPERAGSCLPRVTVQVSFDAMERPTQRRITIQIP